MYWTENIVVPKFYLLKNSNFETFVLKLNLYNFFFIDSAYLNIWCPFYSCCFLSLGQSIK